MSKGRDDMPDYKKMYFTLFRAAKEAIKILIAAQRECEEMYLTAPESSITEVPPPGGKSRQPR